MLLLHMQEMVFLLILRRVFCPLEGGAQTYWHQAYNMIMNDDADLDVSLHFRADEYDYIIYVTTNKIKCFN